MSSSFCVPSATIFSSGHPASSDSVMASIAAERAPPGSVLDVPASSFSALSDLSGSLKLYTLSTAESIAAPSRSSHSKSSTASTETGPVFFAAFGAAHVLSAAAALHHPQVVGTGPTSNMRVEGAHLQFLERHVLHGQLPPPQASKKKQKNTQWRLGHAVAAAAAAVILACSVLGTASQHVPVSDSSGTWSAALFSQGRSNLAAASLPDAGVAIFAGGKGISCDVSLRCCRFFIGAGGA
jgi:hypothetical protein